MDALFRLVDWLGNLKGLKGHRTQVAQGFLTAIAALVAYQGVATDTQLIGAGVDLPDLPGRALIFLAPFSAYFAGKVKQFATEHQPT